MPETEKYYLRAVLRTNSLQLKAGFLILGRVQVDYGKKHFFLWVDWLLATEIIKRVYCLSKCIPIASTGPKHQAKKYPVARFD